jgi:hypothetical protein
VILAVSLLPPAGSIQIGFSLVTFAQLQFASLLWPINDYPPNIKHPFSSLASASRNEIVGSTSFCNKNAPYLFVNFHSQKLARRSDSFNIWASSIAIDILVT